MLFNSFLFAGLFLPLCLLLFWGCRKDSGRRVVLLIGSLIFYGHWFPVHLFLLVGLVGVAWGCALAADRTASTWPIWVAASVLLGVLGYFKYAGFLEQILLDMGLDEAANRRVPQMALPLGISFIVFQALGYVIDVHRREFPAERSFSIVLLFKAFFPQLIAGPICRAHELMPQLKGKFSSTLPRFCSGLAIFSIGLFLKEVFSDSLAILVDPLFGVSATPTRLEAWAAAAGFGGQIYADFWGYSTMAVGLAKMFGIAIPVNFNLPYLASSIREFWRRWHMTLSQWLRDYLYKPLGGSKHGPMRTIGALMATMLVGGLWHGANYTFVVWAGIHAVVLGLEHLVGRTPTTRGGSSEYILRTCVIRFLGWTYTFFVVLVAWVFFRATDLTQALGIITAMVQGPIANASLSTKQITAFTVTLFIVQFPLERLLGMLRKEQLSPAIGVVTAFVLVLGAVVLGAPEAVPFIYFQF